MKPIANYETYQDLVATGQVTNYGSQLGDLDIMNMQIKIDIARSLSVIAEGTKPKFIELTSIQFTTPEKYHIPITGLCYGRSLSHHDNSECGWIMASNGLEFQVSETPDEITKLINLSLGTE